MTIIEAKKIRDQYYDLTNPSDEERLTEQEKSACSVMSQKACKNWNDIIYNLMMTHSQTDSINLPIIEYNDLLD